MYSVSCVCLLELYPFFSIRSQMYRQLFVVANAETYAAGLR